MLFDTSTFRRARTFEIGMRMVAYSPDGHLLATAEGTDGARIWESSAKGKPMPKAIVEDLSVLGKPLRVLLKPSADKEQRAFCADFSPDGKHLLTTHANGHVKLWNVDSGALESDLPLSNKEIRAAAFAPDGKTIMAGDNDGVLHQWSVEKKAEVHATSSPYGAVTGILYSPDGKTLVSVHQSESGAATVIWELDTMKATVKKGIQSAAFSADGKVLALGGSNVQLLDASSWKPIRSIELPEMSLREASSVGDITQPGAEKKLPVSIGALAFSPDGNTLAAGCREGTIRLLKVK